MSRLYPTLIVCLVLLLVQCTAVTPETTETWTLVVAHAGTETTYSGAELAALERTTSTFEGVTYEGVPLHTLLADAGIDPAAVSGLTAVASDGFSAAYTPVQLLRPDTLVAYARAGGPLAAEEAPLRMVLPDEPGRLNVRMLSRLEVAE